MAVPQVNDHPAYIIYRDVAPGEPYDATSPLAFFPPKGSDELFDALRLAFPLPKTHSERMRDAIIQFLLEERQGEQFELSPATTMESSQVTWPSVSSESASAFSSPDLLNFATPASFSDSPLTRQTSTVTSSQPSPPSLDQMTGVFSLSSDPQPKQRVRRKMTEAEKIEYRKRRIVKACDKCAKRKRKCPHNQAEMKTIATPSTKSTSPRSANSTTPSMRQPEACFTPAFNESFDPSAFDPSFDPTAFGSFGDFNMFDDPLPEASVDDFFHFEHFENANTLFNDSFVPTHQSRQHNFPAQDARDNGNELNSRPASLNDGFERQPARLQTSSPLDMSCVSPETQSHTQTLPSQRAARDPRTDVSRSELRQTSNAVERQSDLMHPTHHVETRAARNPHTDGLLSGSRQPSNGVERRSDQLNPVHRLESPDLALRSSDRSSPDTNSNRHDPLLSDQISPTDVPGRQSRQLGASSRQHSALTSTSVSTLSGSPAPRTAPLQGRPQPVRLSNNSVSQEETLGNSEGSRRQTSLGEGMSRTDNLSSELYMLRRRLPAARRTETHASRDGVASIAAPIDSGSKTSRGQQSPDQLSAQANGGAYLQLGSSTIPTTACVNSRAQDGARRSGCGTMGKAQTSSGQDAAASTSEVIYQERLSDHVRYRDHHGRPQGQGLGLPQFAIALGAIVLLAMFSSSSSISATGLALLLVSQSSKSAADSEGIVQYTAKNSSWLSALERQNSPSDVEFRVLKKRQYIRGGGSQAEGSLFESGPDAWLFGLMYPFRLSPMLFSLA